MSRRLLLFLATLACFGAAWIWQRGLLADLRFRNESLHAAKAEAERLASENQELAKLRAAANQGDNGAGNELLRLRNEARQLRAQLPLIDRLRAENARLAATGTSAVVQADNSAELKDYLPREAWGNMGFVTPEATMQSFFWALREKNYAQAVTCFTTQEQSGLRRSFSDADGNFDGLRMEAQFGPLAAVPSLRFRRVEAREDYARVGLQVVKGGAVIEVQLRLEGNEWRIQSF